jgi:hypothetical protein
LYLTSSCHQLYDIGTNINLVSKLSEQSQKEVSGFRHIVCFLFSSTPCWLYTKVIRTGAARVVERLRSKCEALSSNPSAAKKKEEVMRGNVLKYAVFL